MGCIMSSGQQKDGGLPDGSWTEQSQVVRVMRPVDSGRRRVRWPAGPTTTLAPELRLNMRRVRQLREESSGAEG